MSNNSVPKSPIVWPGSGTSTQLASAAGTPITPSSPLQVSGGNVTLAGRRYQPYTPVVWWKMDETSSPFANSGSAGSLNLSIASGASSYPRQAIFGTGRLITTPGSSVCGAYSVAGSATGQLGNSGTILAWVKVRTLPSGIWPPIFMRAYKNGWDGIPAWGTIGIQFSNASNGQLQFFGAIGSPATVFGMFTGSQDYLTTNQWYLVAHSYDATTGIATGYINGDVVATASVGAGNNLNWGSNGPWAVNGNPFNNSEYINGTVVDAQGYSQVLTSAQLTQMYQLGIGYY